MTMNTELSEADEGKRVIDRDGTEVGTVQDVDFSSIRMASDHELSDPMRKLDEGPGDTIYEFQEKIVTEVTDEEVRIDQSI